MISRKNLEQLLVQSSGLLFVEFLTLAGFAFLLPFYAGFFVTSLFFWWVAGCCFVLSVKYPGGIKIHVSLYVAIVVFVSTYGVLYEFVILKLNKEGGWLDDALSITVSIITLLSYLYLAHLITTIESIKKLPRKSKTVTFLEIVFFPIGVWFLQPRLKNVLQSS